MFETKRLYNVACLHDVHVRNDDVDVGNFFNVFLSIEYNAKSALSP